MPQIDRTQIRFIQRGEPHVGEVYNRPTDDLIKQIDIVLGELEGSITNIATGGISPWDTNVAYLADVTYAIGPTSGDIYRAKVDNIGENPDEDTNEDFWTVAFITTASGYTRVQSDARFLRASLNGADVPDPEEFRNNLGIISDTDVIALAPKGFISFNGATGIVYSSRNLTLTKLGTGRYRLNIASGARSGNSNYCVVVSAIDTGVTSQASTLSAGAHNTTTASLSTRSTTYFDVNCVLRSSKLAYAGGNDANNAQALAIDLSDHAYISLSFFW